MKALYGPAKAAKVYRPSRPEVDALVVLPGALLLIEAKIQKYMDGFAKLPIYASLVPHTEELMVFRDRPVMMHLLLPKAIPWITAVAAEHGVEVKLWATEEIMQIWEDRDKYWTPQYRMQREDRKALLEKLGFR